MFALCDCRKLMPWNASVQEDILSEIFIFLINTPDLSIERCKESSYRSNNHNH